MGGGKFGGLVPRKFDVLQGGKVFYVVGRVDFFAVQNVFGVEKLFFSPLMNISPDVGW